MSPIRNSIPENICTLQRTLVIMTVLVTKDFAVKSNLPNKKILDMGPSKASITDTFEHFYESYFCVFVRIAILTNAQNVWFPEE